MVVVELKESAKNHVMEETTSYVHGSNAQPNTDSFLAHKADNNDMSVSVTPSIFLFEAGTGR